LEPYVYGGAVSFWRSRQRLLLFAGFLILILLLWRPGADRLRSRLEHVLGSALGHKVEIGNVSLQILPQPGFHLSNFSVHDDPQFSAEPILHADEVSATLHPSSLWRWRIEIATLSFKDASLNLVRRSDGRWNIEPLLERAAHIPAAPTGNTRSESRPRVPYIEVTNGRVNLKLGSEKTPYALMEADLALWLASNDEWGMRLKGQPVRTDMRLSDTGTLRASGTWRRADDLRKTTIRLNASYEGAQLGQLTKLIDGADKGLRGTVTVSANITGSAEDLRIQSGASVDNFRRYDIVAGRSLRLAADCAARYTSISSQFSEIVCTSPAENGSLQLLGNIALTSPPTYALNVNAAKFPTQQLTDVIRQLKKGLPEDFSTTGLINAELSFRKNAAGSAAWSGSGEINSFTIRSSTLQTRDDEDTLTLRRVPFRAISIARDSKTLKTRNGVAHTPGLLPTDFLPSGNIVEVGPFPVDLTSEEQGNFHAWFSGTGYGVSFSGEGPVQRLLQIGRTAGTTVIHPAIEGDAKFDWQARGDWSGFAAPQTSEIIQLRNGRAEFAGLNAPIEITATDIILTPGTIRLDKLSATAGGIHWTGSIVRPRVCAQPVDCLVTIDLHADEISTSKLNLLLNPNVHKQPWYRVLTGGGQQSDSVLGKLSVQGILRADRLVTGDLRTEAISTELKLQDGHLHLANLRGSVLGGRHSGDWQADFTKTTPEYKVSGKFENISLPQLSKLMHSNWVTGTAKASYEVNLSGWGSLELLSSSRGTLAFEAFDGTLVHFGPATSALRFQHLQGKLAEGKTLVVLSQGKLRNAQGIYSISGVTSFGYRVDFKFLRNDNHGFSVTGALDQPRVETITAKSPPPKDNE
jgi:AsmA family